MRTLVTLLALALAACAPPDDDGADAPGGDADTDVVVVDTDTDVAVVDTDTDVVVVETDVVDTVVVDTEVPLDTDPGPPPTLLDCFGGQWRATPPIDYASVTPPPVMGRHCKGTNHQDIQGVERVVYVGDSVTVGTPALQGATITDASTWWRNKTADQLATRFGLRRPGWRWRQVELIGDGMSLEMFSGDFASCAKFGARTDDLLRAPHEQLVTCNPEADRQKKTLILMTSGGNDIFSLLEDAGAGVDEATLRATYTRALDDLRDAIAWVKAPGRFPNGVYVVFANTFEFVDYDSSQDMAACPGAGLIGLSGPLQDTLVQDILAEAQAAYLQLAVDTQTDMVFLGEGFCGHGFDRTRAMSRCYRGPGAKLWYDEISCEHPNAHGHAGLTDMFLSTVDE